MASKPLTSDDFLVPASRLAIGDMVEFCNEIAVVVKKPLVPVGSIPRIELKMLSGEGIAGDRVNFECPNDDPLIYVHELERKKGTTRAIKLIEHVEAGDIIERDGCAGTVTYVYGRKKTAMNQFIEVLMVEGVERGELVRLDFPLGTEVRTFFVDR